MFKLIADTSFSWEYVKDDGGFSYVSPSCEHLTGYAPGEFLSNPRLLEEIVHPSDLESFREHLQKAPGDGEAARLRLRLICRDGCERWVEHACRPLSDENGQHLGLRCSVRALSANTELGEAHLRIQARYETMVGLQSEAICFWHPDTRLTFVNEAYCRLTGRSRRELLGRSWLTLIPPDVREQVRSFYETLIAEPTVTFYEHEVTGPDGRTLWMQWVDAPIFDEAGALLEFLSIGRDITRERDANTRLRDSEERFRAFMSQLPALAFIKDEQSRILFTNAYMNDLMGSQGWIGRDALENLPAVVAAKIMADDRRVLEGGRPVVIEEAIPVRSGETRVFETRKFPIGREGKPPLLGAIGLDITDKKRSEDALRASEERYRQLAEASRDFIFVLDRDDRFAYVNSAAQAVTGKRPEELIGRPRASLDLPPEMLARQKEANDTVFSTGEPLCLEGQFLMGSGGRPAWHSVTLVPLKDGNGGIHALLGVARDVTESRERAQRLEEANIAMKVLLRHREEDRRELEEQFLANFRKLIMPSLEKLRRSGLTPRQSAYVDIVEMNARKVFSASGAAAGLAQASFTPMEMRIVEYIKEDKTTKEIGGLLNLSPRTVEYYRDRIRKKLGLKSRNVNLRSYLYSLS